MNRVQKRQFTKNMRNKGKTEQEIDDMIELMGAINKVSNETTVDSIPEGTKVKLNIEKIKSNVDYKAKVEKYKQFVDDNSDNILTVESGLSSNNEKLKYLFCFKEDTSDQKWLFHDSEVIMIDKGEYVND